MGVRSQSQDHPSDDPPRDLSADPGMDPGLKRDLLNWCLASLYMIDWRDVLQSRIGGALEAATSSALGPTHRLRGRPSRSPEDGERVGMSLRITPEMKRRLVQACADNGRSISQESENRLERSFLLDDLIKTKLLTQATIAKLAEGLPTPEARDAVSRP